MKKKEKISNPLMEIINYMVEEDKDKISNMEINLSDNFYKKYLVETSNSLNFIEESKLYGYEIKSISTKYVNKDNTKSICINRKDATDSRIEDLIYLFLQGKFKTK